MTDEILNIDETLVDYAEMSGLDLTTGRYPAETDLLNNEINETENGFLEMVSTIKSVFVKQKETV